MVIALAVDLLGARQKRLDAATNAELHKRVARVGLLNDAVDEFTDAILILVEHHVALGLADALKDYLLGGLGGNPPKILWRYVSLLDLVAVDRELLGVDHRFGRLNVFACLGVEVCLFVDRLDD